GFNSAGDWIRINCHMNSNTVWNALTVGERAGQLEQSVEAMNSGEIGFAHLATLARTADAVGEAFDESKLLGLAKEHSAGKFHYKALHYRHSVDPEAYAKNQAALAETRGLHLSTAEDGFLLISGALDPVGGAVLRTALEPLARKSGRHDDRDLDQRYADALVELAASKQKVSLQVTASVETLLGKVGAPGAENEFTLPISSAAVQRLACDCSVTRVLLSQESLVIDVGRASRVVGPALRKALVIRHRHCRWPGCERPASWCDAHHLVHWIDDGLTDLDNLVLLCRRHHRMVHEGGWQLIKTEDEKIIAIAPTVTFGLPRGPD
ncbi:MAG TPA: DUF222 domain-containing protein, partial [Candidatus Limnocylindrales bacterium]|nr:DUF222 domain-containing protein [Candidatus Limnocylindrales bacterium]